MHSAVTSEIWDELKRYINPGDRGEAAEMLVSVLVNHDEDVDDIRQEFRNDPDIKAALSTYLDDYQEEEEEEDYLDGMEDPDY